MIQTEDYSVREDGVLLKRITSTAWMKIADESGNVYNEAIIPASIDKTYTETDEMIDQDDEDLKTIIDIVIAGKEATDD